MLPSRGRTDRYVMKLNKERCKVLRPGRNNPMHQYVLRADWLENRIAEKDLGSWWAPI